MDEETHGGFSYDCLAILGMTFEQAADTFGWAELINFMRHLPESSATYRAMNEDAYRFASDLQESAILADIYDAISTFAYMFNRANGGHAKKPNPYKRPWLADDSSEQHFGKDPIPIADFNSWYYGGEN